MSGRTVVVGRLRGCMSWVSAFLAAFAVGAAAQAPAADRVRIEPYVGSLSRDYPVVGLAVRGRRAAPPTARAAFLREWYVAAGATFSGGVRAQAHVRIPGSAPSGRLTASVAVTRKARFFFAGLGNASQFNRSLERDRNAEYYSVRRNRLVARLEGSRWLVGRVGAAIGAGVENVSFTAYPGETVFRSEFGASRRETDATASVTVFYDTRDSESIPRSGVLLQVGSQLGTGAGAYWRFFSVGQGYLRLRQTTGIALRGAMTTLAGDPPLVARYELAAWERGIPLFGGDDSHRGLSGQRLIGTSALFANAELHHDLGMVRGQTIGLIGLVDAGRVFEGEPVRIGVAGVKVSAGVGLALRGARERIGAGIVAIGPDGPRVSLVSGWPF